MSEPAQPFSLAAGEGRVLPTPAGGQVTFKVRSEQASGNVSVLEFEVPAGAGPRLHVHEQKEECIYVLHAPRGPACSSRGEPRTASEPGSDPLRRQTQ